MRLKTLAIVAAFFAVSTPAAAQVDPGRPHIDRSGIESQRRALDGAVRAARRADEVRRSENRLRRLRRIEARDRAARQSRALERLRRRQAGPQNPTLSQRLTAERLRRAAQDHRRRAGLLTRP